MSKQRELINQFRFILLTAFLPIYVVAMYLAVFSIRLESDFLVYYTAYNSWGSIPYTRFGLEFIPVVLYKLAGQLGLSYYQFNFVFGLAWGFGLFCILKNINIIFFPLIFAFALVLFVDQFAFLYRQYLGFLFLVFYFVSDGKVKPLLSRFFLFLAVFSHLTMLLYYLLSKIRWRNPAFSLLMILIVIIDILTSFISKLLFSFISNLTFLGLSDLDRKLLLLERANEMSGASSTVVIMLLVGFFIHSTFIHYDNLKHSLLRLLYFCSFLVIVFSDYQLISNRLGMPAYYFSVFYLSLTITQFFRLNANYFNYLLRGRKLETQVFNHNTSV